MNKKLLVAVLAVVIIAALALLARPIPVIENPRVRASINNAAGYFTLRNYGLAGYCVVGVEMVSPQGVMAKMYMSVQTEGGMHEHQGMHEHKEVDKVCVGPFGVAEFKPGGYHLMIMEPLDIGSDVKFRLKLDDGSKVEVVAKVGMAEEM